ncbi:hypothetical protein F5050DRAFT_1713080 [Lentinula boryana]|uniref:Uncharacterized protein n=1 Tax=Lentinula boryana TaxID=40481 RepID=A0ABQ8Q9N5_9AGAR|nr:hypothetical protein F5050DRAFT_1713080 [Lentinula boryana]
MSVHFPSSSDSISRARFTYARRVPNDKASNRHMACVGEGFADKVTFCSSVGNTYTTVTFTPPARRVRHSDAADSFPSRARFNRLAENEEVKAAAGVETKMKKGYSQLFLKKVRSLLNRNSGNNSKGSSQPPHAVSSVSGQEPRPRLTDLQSVPAASASLHRFPKRTVRPVASVATIPCTRTQGSSNVLNSDKPSVRRAREPRTRVIRRSRSFDDAECSSLAACIALDEAVRDLIARESAENQQRDNEVSSANRISREDSDIATDDEETLQNHGSPDGGVWILEDLMDLLKAENDQIAALLAEDEDRYP